MARLLFEFRATRRRTGALASGIEYVVYSDLAGTVLADISASSGGSSIAGSTVTTADIAGLGPSAVQFWGPTDGTDVLYVRCPSDATLGVQKVNAETDARLDALEAGGGGGAHPNLATHDALGLATDAELTAHAADTTAVHGVADTTRLVTAEDLALAYPVPPTIPGLFAWYAASGITGLADGASVTTWEDLSGNGYHATQATAANKPTYQTAELNSEPVVRFDATNDGLVTAAFSPALAQPDTIIVVSRLASVGGTECWYDAAPGGSRQILYNSGNLYKQWAGTDLVGPTINTAAHVIASVFNGGTSTMRIDGVQVAAGAVGSQTLGSLTIGNAQALNGGLNGDLAELVIYNRALTTAEQQRLEWYFGVKYGIAVTLAGFDPTDPPPAPPLAADIVSTATSIVVREPLTQATLDARAASGGTLRVPAGSHTVDNSAGPVTWQPGVVIQGEGKAVSRVGSANGSTLTAASNANNLFQLPSSVGGLSGWRMEHVKLVGGLNQVANPTDTPYHTFAFFDDVYFAQAAVAGVELNAAVEEWWFTDCYFTASQYGFRKRDNGATSLYDKSGFTRCWFDGCTEYGTLIETDLGNTLRFSQCVWQNNTKHGCVLDGAITYTSFVDCATEGNGHENNGDSAVYAVGSISSTSTTLTTTTSVTIANGRPITVQGAGTAGADLQTTVAVGGTGTSFTLAAAAGTTVAGAEVCTGQYDDFFFNSSIGVPNDIRFAGGSLGNLGGSPGFQGKLRYSVNNVGGGRIVGAPVFTSRPIYDPLGNFEARGGEFSVRRPALYQNPKRRVSGDIAVNSTSWIDLDTGLDLTVRAQAGDRIEVSANGLWNQEGVQGYLDVATIVSAAPVTYFSSGTGTPVGLPGWHSPSGYISPFGGSASLVVAAADLSGGAVTLRLRTKTGTAAVKTLNAGASFPLQFAAKNLGPG